MTTQNVLDTMTAGIMEKKAAKQTKLTPVGMEAPSFQSAILDVPTKAAFPFDQPDLIQKALADARQDILFVLEGIDKIIAAFGETKYQTSAPAGQTAAQKEAERKADEQAAFRRDFEEKQRAAQEATFGKTESPFNDLPHEAPAHAGWTCPVHPTAPVNDLVSKRGREYKACTKCEEFER